MKIKFDTNQQSVFSNLIGSEDFNDLTFIDNVTAVAVGDNGTFYKFTGTGISLDGYPTNGYWTSQPNFFAAGVDPLGVNAYGQVNIYTVDYSSSTNGLFGGEYINASFDNAASCYVRKIYDAHARYSVRFYYDKLGRLVVSQNARQYNTEDIFGNAKKRKYSYTLYDPLGRVIEVGEKTENEIDSSGNQVELTFEDIFGTNVSGYYNPSVMDDAKLLAWIQGQGARKEVTKSYYDKSVISGLPTTFSPDSLTQRKRITHVTYEAIFDGNDQTYDHATHYDYDIHGNVKTLLQDNFKMATDFTSIADQRFKRMDYVYDLVSGNVHRMSVQNGEIDQWHHAYRYDADNRILSAHTTTETPILDGNNSAQALENELVQNTDWEQDAKYLYYDHGPLSRVEIGNHQIQGMDFTYNLQGWMKGVNATTLDQNIDPGKDGLTDGSNSVNGSFAKDVMAYSLHYFYNDYNPIGATGSNPTITSTPAASVENSDVSANSFDLFNGNIKAMQTTLTNPITNEILPMANAYIYDQLNRLLESKSFINLSGNQWENSGAYDNRYLNSFEYDAMGNIIHQNRYTADGVQIEDMSYGYKRNSSGELLRNRLYHINEPDILTGLSDSDIDNMPGTYNPQDQNIDTSYNYMYDEEGRLVRDKQEQIEKIIWRVDGKVKEIRRPQGSGKKNISFDYDAMGNRVAKHVYDDDWNLEYTTYYILDAQGNQLSVYNHEVSNSTVSFNLRERHIYGSSSLGIRMDSLDVNSIVTGNTLTELGKKTYSMSNHLGNVLTVVSDIKIPLSTDGITVDSYRVGIRNISDYSPFGVLLAERTVEGAFYRNGFQGQERDDEVKGEGNSVNYKYRMHDPRVGRFFTVDPLAMKYPWNSSYAFSENRVIDGVEFEGLEWESLYDDNGNLTGLNLSLIFLASEPIFDVYDKDDLILELNRQFTLFVFQNFGVDIEANLKEILLESACWNTPYVGGLQQVSGNVGGATFGFIQINLSVNKENPKELKNFVNDILHELIHNAIPGHPADRYLGGDDKLIKSGENTFQMVPFVTNPNIMDDIMLYPYFTINGIQVGDYRNQENYDVPLKLTRSEANEMLLHISKQEELGSGKYERWSDDRDLSLPQQEIKKD